MIIMDSRVKKQLFITISIICILCCSMSCYCLREYVGVTDVILIYGVLLFSLWSCFNKTLDFLKGKTYEWSLICVFSAFFSLSVCGAKLVNRDNENVLCLIFIVLLTIIWIIPILINFVALVTTCDFKRMMDKKPLYRVFGTYFIICVLINVIVLRVFYPGIMSSD